jgi:hypothetical protein
VGRTKELEGLLPMADGYLYNTQQTVKSKNAKKFDL